MHRTDIYHGNFTTLDVDPDILHLRDVVYMPIGHTHAAAGLYNYGRKLIPESVYSLGPDVNAVFPGLGMQLSYSSIDTYADEDFYIYVGHLHEHFGHFLLSTISRFWSRRLFAGNTKIACQVSGSLAHFLAKPHVAYLLKGLGIDPGRFVSFAAPVKLRNVLLPVSSFEERNYVHSAFARMTNAIGETLAGPPDRSARRGVAYLSKHKLKYGVRNISNELELCTALSSRGVDIVFPETLPLPEQVKLWDRYEHIISFSSSALHASCFRPACKLTCLLYDQLIDSSYMLLDWSNRNEAHYFAFEGDSIIYEGPSNDYILSQQGFHSQMRLAQPQAVAHEILAYIDRVS